MTASGSRGSTPGAPSGREAAEDLEARLREELCRVGRRLHEAGLIAGLAGNLSARLPDDAVLVTPRGIRKDGLRPGELVRLDLERPADDDLARATTEWPMHRACYRAAAASGSVIHTHAPALTAAGLRGLDVGDALPEAADSVGGIRLVPWAPAGSEALGRRVARAVEAGAGVLLLARHGALAVGRTPAEAFDRMELAELTARAVLLAL